MVHVVEISDVLLAPTLSMFDYQFGCFIFSEGAKSTKKETPRRGHEKKLPPPRRADILLRTVAFRARGRRWQRERLIAAVFG